MPKHKGRVVPASAVADGPAWWKAAPVQTAHDWKLSFEDDGFVASCGSCPARIRIEVGETPAKVLLVAKVVDAGEGMYADELDWLCDRVFAMLGESAAWGRPGHTVAAA
jgi:hypothetical protein